MTPRLPVPLLAAALALAGPGSGCSVETTYQDVYPILQARCNSCHVDGISTYRPYFTDYDTVSSLERILRDAVTSREMPPFGMDDSTLCGNNYFADEGMWLGDVELKTITDWVDDGVPKGDVSDLMTGPAVPGYVEPELDHVDRTIDTGDAYAFSGFDPDTQHRCFIADPALDDPVFLSGFQVRPGNKFSVQSLALYALDDPDTQAAAGALVGKDGAPGYPCFGGAKIDGARFLGTWVWGRNVVRFPQGTGIRLAPGTKLVVQIHYNPQGGSLHPGDDLTQVDLELVDDATEATYRALSADGFSLRPGVADAVARGYLEVKEPFTILAVAPLMHQSGETLEVDRVRPFSDTCLAQVQHWEFESHLRLFQYLTPPPQVFPGDRLEITCGFQTQSRIEPTRQGEDASSEQCLARLYTVPM